MPLFYSALNIISSKYQVILLLRIGGIIMLKITQDLRWGKGIRMDCAMSVPRKKDALRESLPKHGKLCELMRAWLSMTYGIFISFSPQFFETFLSILSIQVRSPVTLSALDPSGFAKHFCSIP